MLGDAAMFWADDGQGPLKRVGEFQFLHLMLARHAAEASLGDDGASHVQRDELIHQIEAFEFHARGKGDLVLPAPRLDELAGCRAGGRQEPVLLVRPRGEGFCVFGWLCVGTDHHAKGIGHGVRDLDAC